MQNEFRMRQQMAISLVAKSTVHSEVMRTYGLSFVEWSETNK